MWLFGSKGDSNKIEIHLEFWGGEVDPSFTVRLVSDKQTVLEGVGVVQGSDFRVSNIKTEPAYRRKGFGTTVIGALIGAARARKCTTFTLEEVSPKNSEAIDMYLRFGAVALPPKKVGGHVDYQIQL